MINSHIEGASAVAEVTGASVENMGLVWRGDSDIAFALADTVYQAYHGTGDFEGRQLDNIRALASVYPNAVQLVTLADSGIESLEDLRGKRVSVGAPGSGTELNARAVLEANGISYDDFTPSGSTSTRPPTPSATATSRPASGAWGRPPAPSSTWPPPGISA